jgi:polysaccharide export outer membrane protein
VSFRAISRGVLRLTLVLWASLPATGETLAAPPAAPANAAGKAADSQGAIQLGPGDSVTLSVFGQPDMTTTDFVADDGTLAVPLIGQIPVQKLSPAEASRRIEKALRDKKILVDPHVTISAIVSKSQRVSLLGEVGRPGRYVIESKVAIFDLLAEAGGVTADGSDIVYLLRPDKDGKVVRYEINLKTLADGKSNTAMESIQPGDSILVPRAEQFYIYGEVSTPGKFRIEPGMTVIQAIARAGGISLRGSTRRVEIKRLLPDGNYETTKAKLGDPVRPDDVIRVKESIF